MSKPSHMPSDEQSMLQTVFPSVQPPVQSDGHSTPGGAGSDPQAAPPEPPVLPPPVALLPPLPLPPVPLDVPPELPPPEPFPPLLTPPEPFPPLLVPPEPAPAPAVPPLPGAGSSLELPQPATTGPSPLQKPIILNKIKWLCFMRGLPGAGWV